MSKPSPNASSPMAWLMAIVVPVVAVGGVVLGVIVLGGLARDHLAEKGLVEFAAIECTSPPNMSREEFLGEVQFMAGLPDRLEVSDELPIKLLRAFALHPWVEEVKQIERLPEHRARVRLIFRTPVLAVEQNGKKRAVDRKGIRLPDAAPTEGLPVFHTDQPPTTPEGTPWGAEVTAAAESAAREQLKTPPGTPEFPQPDD